MGIEAHMKRGKGGGHPRERIPAKRKAWPWKPCHRRRKKKKKGWETTKATPGGMTCVKGDRKSRKPKGHRPNKRKERELTGRRK